MFPDVVATACAGIFAGAALYISVVQQPAAAELGTASAVRFFHSMYARAAPLQVSLAMIGTLGALWVWWSGGGRLWLLGAVLLGLVIPFTLVVIMPTNRRLSDAGLDPASAEAEALLGRWARLHAVRSGASVAAFAVFLMALRVS